MNGRTKPSDKGDIRRESNDETTKLPSKYNMGEVFASIDKNLDKLLTVDRIFEDIWNLVNTDKSSSMKLKEAVKIKLEKAGAFVGSQVEAVTNRLKIVKNENITVFWKKQQKIYGR